MMQQDQNIQLVLDSRLPIGIVPVVSANGLATEIRIPRDINELSLKKLFLI